MAMTNAERCARYRNSEKGRAAALRRDAKREEVRLNFHHENDADILAALDPERPTATQLKELIRLGIEARSKK